MHLTLFGFFLLVFVGWPLLGGVAGVFVARSKNREAWEGALLGIVFGVLGVLVEAVLPTLPASPPLTGRAAANPAVRTPLEIVHERYARGEISREEFQQLKDDLA